MSIYSKNDFHIQIVFLTVNCSVSCLESLCVGSKPMVALSLAELPGDSGHLVLATGGLDHKVHLFRGERSGKVRRMCCDFMLKCSSCYKIF